ncbi:MAG: hypothetical protein EBT09_10610 [Actinobacteria bacterium]|nr:hypothetical protein [Actinomycetota bacterium]
MRVGSFAVARPAYYDRSPTAANPAYYGQAVPHAQTTRWTVTNTAAQKMYVDAASITIIRATVPTTSGLYYAAIFGPTGQPLLMVHQSVATVGNPQNISSGGSILVLQSQSITGVTYDDSTGGVVTYGVFAHGIQFDA